MSEPLLKLLTPAGARLLHQAEVVFAEAGADAYLVGGSLRDALLGLHVADLDIAAGGDALTLARTLADRIHGAFVVLDAERGVARIVTDSTDGRAHLDIARLQGGSLQADLGRRDFTVNAMALPLTAAPSSDWQDQVMDPFRGREDLAARRLRLVSPTALADDPARLLRAVRIAAHRGMTLDAGLEEALARGAGLMERVAPDRLRDEFLLLLEAPNPTQALHTLDHFGLLMRLFPEIAPMRACLQPPEHHWDVLEHTLQTVGFAHKLLSREGLPSEVLNEVPWDDALAAHFAAAFAHEHPRGTFVKLAALFHDIGKPASRSVEPSGRTRFLGHPELGAEMAKATMARLHFSGKAVRHMALMVLEHLRPTQLVSPRRGAPGEMLQPQQPSRRAVWRYHRDLGDAAVDTLYLSLADHLGARGPDFEFPRWQRHATICSSVLRNESGGRETRKPRLVTGYDLMSRFGLEPGPPLGRLLKAIEEAAGAGDIASREEALELARRLLASNHSISGDRKS